MKIFGLKREQILELFERGEITFAVYGLGKMGLPLAAVIADKGGKVVGVDINKRIVEGINKGLCHVREPGLAEMVARNVENGRLTATSDLVRAAKDSDVMIILVPTLLDSRNNPDLSVIKSVSKSISRGLVHGDLVITESTLPPRTTRDVILPILLDSGLKTGDFGLAHCPERTMSGRAILDITGAYPKIVGGIDEKSTETASAIYSRINSKGVIKVSDATTAEAVKVFEGLYRDVNIALANELEVICQELGIDAVEAFNAANTQPYSHLHMPGCGVGGHCIPVYPYFIIKTVKSPTRLLTLSRQINDGMAGYTVSLVEKGLKEAGAEIKGSNVLVLGITYRGDVEETRCSPAISMIDLLKRKGAKVFAYDPLLSDRIEDFGAAPRSIEDVSDIDAIIIASDFKEFRTIDWRRLNLRHKVMVDGRQVVDPKEIRKAGFIFYGIGVKLNTPHRGMPQV